MMVANISAWDLIQIWNLYCINRMLCWWQKFELDFWFKFKIFIVSTADCDGGKTLELQIWFKFEIFIVSTACSRWQNHSYFISSKNYEIDNKFKLLRSSFDILWGLVNDWGIGSFSKEMALVTWKCQVPGQYLNQCWLSHEDNNTGNALHRKCYYNNESIMKMHMKYTHSKFKPQSGGVNSLRPGQNGRHFPDEHLKCIFLNENKSISINISLKFVPKGRINNIPALVQMMAWRRLGDKPLSEPMMVGLLTHICVTRPQWVNSLWANDAVWHQRSC